MDNGLEKSRGLGKVAIIFSMLIFICLAGCSKQFARIEENQSQLQAMIQANSDNIAKMTEYIERNQSELLGKISQNQLETENIAQDVILLSETQEKLHKSSQNNINELAVHLNQVSSNQEELKAGLVVSHNETAQVAKNLNMLEQNQAELYETIRNNNNTLSERVASLEQGQVNLFAKIEGSENQTLKVSSELALLGNEQAKLYESSQSSIKQLAGQLNKVASNQDILKQKQVELYNTVQNNNKELSVKVASIENKQGDLFAGIEDSKKQTLKVSSDIALFNNENTKLFKLSQNTMNKIIGQLSQVSNDQAVLKTGLVASHNETAKVSNNLNLLSKAQKELNDILKSNNSNLLKKVAHIEQNQNELQAGLEKIQYDTGFVAQDIQTIEQDHKNLHETVSSYNQQMLERVDLIELNKKQWQTAIQQMQESVKLVAGNVETFEQSLSKLEEILQGKIGDLVAVSSTNSKDQSEFQEKIKNDLLSLVDSVNIIKKSQSQLQQKIDDVQNKTENIAVEFPIAIEKLRNELKVDGTDVYSSDN